ncbi:ATP dependent PIM1 peptidase. Serine peptidase. MEROPS family S16 [Ferrimonas sediminum]|uniref:Lon protease n=1 Tax=Ferrimonas sediminum TaxID=718193 RepID=A0A1G8U9E0_9GAMM|nr:endopeptidase La [Ferrimonas sediminum]SDJ50426.1 ATP dependent PIM1 peptidase. Serine peptidase. MEROPS family S16 [Ferrimonas sediminum]
MHQEDIDVIDNDEPQPTDIVVAGEQRPDQLHVMPVQNRPFFPAQVMPVLIKSGDWIETLKAVGETDHKMLALFYSEDFDHQEGRFNPQTLPQTGCVVRVHQVKEGDDGDIQFIAEGIERVHIDSWESTSHPYLANVSYPETEQDSEGKEIKAYAMALINAIKELLPINPLLSEELKDYLNRFGPNEPSPLTDFGAAITTAPGPLLQEVVDQVALLPRMEKTLALLKKELDAARLHSEIAEEVNRKISKHEREFFLREQLRVIQKELGVAKDDKTADLEEFNARMQGKTLPEAAEKKFKEEMQKFSVLESGSPEYAVSRNYLDWITQMPWGIHSTDKLELSQARTILDKHHDGLDDVKDRILEFLALGAFKGEISGSIILLVGPPGVGKTSIGRSIAECLDRPFYRFSVGGMRDEAEIKGHRRTYIGAMPGKLVQALKEAEVMNPVIMLDEIDKMGSSYQGDPASALLETLDPEQNVNFLDHYLDLRLDLSKVLFVCTANTLDSIPAPLLDRMDVIHLSGYLAEEKLAIGKHHLWPRQLKRAGVKRSQLKITDAALKKVVVDYCREAGVRSLDKALAKLVRKSVVKLLQDPQQKLSLGLKAIPELLGPAKFKAEQTLCGTGIVTGLAWTSVGGATLPVEANSIHQQSRGLKLTGQLGDVMKESAEIAFSFISSHLSQYDVEENYFDKRFVHLHVPEGATPKDGPSAGITMSTALLSLALGKAPKKHLAMTGEITLNGYVLAVGGIREKLIAAKRQGIKEVLLPEECSGDYQELPDHVKEGLKVHFVSHFDQVAKLAFD